MGYINILSQSTNIVQNSGINFNKAITAIDNEGFVLSGSKRILKYLFEKLGEDISFIIDFSSVPSSFKNDKKLADFITICDNASVFVDSNNFEYAFYHVYGPLQRQNLGMFYHPRFFDSPQSPTYYYSSFVNQDLKNYDEDRIVIAEKECWSSIKKNIYFKNKSFSISYEDYKKKSEEAQKIGVNCQERNEILLKFYNKYFLRDKEKIGESQLIAIPLIGYPGRETNETAPYEGLGAIFVYFIKKGINDSTVNEIANDLWFLGLQITYNSIFQIAMELAEKARKESIKSAKAAIMSRNMSHNLGSHVMSYLKQKLGNITSILNDNNKVLYNLIESNNLNESLIEKFDQDKTYIDNIKERVQLPFLVGTGRFIGYIQERQDYIATIATDYIPYGAPVNLKDAVYDELNPDLRYMRHNAEDNNRPMNILLNYIAKSEGFSRENMGIEADYKQKEDNNEKEVDNKLKYRTTNDILFGYPKYWVDENSGELKCESFGLSEETQDSTNPAMTEMRSVNFSMPGGLVGRQALFSIIENLIRNAAKHGDTGNIKNLAFTFDTIPLFELDKCPGVEERICDETWRKLYKNASDVENLYLFTITDNLFYDDKVLSMLMKGLYEPYVDSYGNMTTGNKGIKEIRISAAWLRNNTDEDNYYRYGDLILDNTKKKAPLVAIELTANKNLRYMICLMRDRFAAVVTNGMPDEDIKRFRELQTLSPKEWTLYNSIDEVKTDYKISYRYIFVANVTLYNQLRPYTSNRLIIWCNKEDVSKQLYKDWCGIRAENDETVYKCKKALVLRYLYQNIFKNELFSKNDDDSVFEPIYIWDGTSAIAHENDIVPSMIKLSTNDSTKGANGVEGADVAKYVYRTHHSSEKDFLSYWKSKCLEGRYHSIACIDAVTGDNSSDRLVRREKLDDEWYYSHLNAFKKCVAIFDERIFKIVHNVDETEFIKKSISANYIKKLIEKITTCTEDFDTIKEEILTEGILPGNILEEIEFINKGEELYVLLQQLVVTFVPQYVDNYKSIVYKEKGVDVFTIIEERKGQFVVVGYVGKTKGDNDSLTLGKYDKIATIKNKESNGEFEITIEIEKQYQGLFENKYDYISIHQGLLDKLYEGFNIKTASEVNNPKKGIVTTCLYEQFMCKQNVIGDFLPCFIIHSGRAKPTKDDMPQELPFIQYAAIEHAVQDCKYALVELLDYARYDPNDN